MYADGTLVRALLSIPTHHRQSHKRPIHAQLRSFYKSGGRGTAIITEVSNRLACHVSPPTDDQTQSIPTTTISQVKTHKETSGPMTRVVFQPLVFARPEIREEDEKPLVQQLAGSGVDALGRITLEVWEAIKKPRPTQTMGTIASAAVRCIVLVVDEGARAARHLYTYTRTHAEL